MALTPKESLPELPGQWVQNKSYLSIAKGMDMSIRKMGEVERLALLAKEIEIVAELYCGAVIDEKFERVIDELLPFVVDRFGMIGIEEIRYAFRLASAGEIGEIDMKAYYGLVTVNLFGRVLGAYVTYRQQIVKDLWLERERMEKERKEAELKEYWNSAEGKREIREMNELRRKKLLEMEKVTIKEARATDYEYLVEIGEIELTNEEKLALLEEARVNCIEECHRQILTAKNEGILYAWKTRLKTLEERTDDWKYLSASRAKLLAVVNWKNQISISPNESISEIQALDSQLL